MTRTVYGKDGSTRAPEKREPAWTPEGQEHYANERAWRKAGMSEKDRTHLEKDEIVRGLAHIDAMHPRGTGGTALAEYPTLRPMRHHVWGRRRSLYEDVRALGIAIPELVDRPDSQRRGMLYEVLAVGEGVTSVRVGDVVVVNHCVAADRGHELGEGVYDFTCDLHYVELRTHETEWERLPDGTRRSYQRRMSDTERRSCGDVLAVLHEGA